MANNKLTWTDLRRALAKRAGVSEKEANTFLGAFNAQLIEALKQDKQVKVNGLGMFKLQAVAPRKSVNVTTGEQITIEGYNKLSFVPEAGVKELVEKGEVKELKSEGVKELKSEGLKELKSEGESVDPLKKLGAQAEEIVDILGELGQPVHEPEPEKPEVQPEPEPEKPEVQPEPEPEPEPEPIIIAPKAPEEKGKKQYHFVRDTLICVVILLLLLLVGYFFLRHQISDWIENLAKPQPIEVIESQEPKVESQPVEETEQPKAEEAAWTYDDILLVEKITDGSRLSWIAKKHYGDKAYWPHIYAANKDRLKNPSRIAVGTPIRVPKLNASMRDTTSVQFQQLKEEAYSAVR